jgi:hypothetical protein
MAKKKKGQNDKQRSTKHTHKTKDRVTRAQRPKEKVQEEKQRSTKHTHKTKDRVTRTSLKQEVNSGAPEGQAVAAPLVAPVVLI